MNNHIKKKKSKDSKWIYVKESSIHNKGVFALTDIPKGTKIIEYTGEKITKDVAEERMERDLKNGTFYVFEIDDKYDIDGLVGGSDAIYINHSCNPNCEIKGNKRIWIVALKDIKKEEELNYDYSFECDLDTLKHPCRCGYEKCLGYIVDFKEKNKLKKMLQSIKTR